jgi:hypothetical protein
MATAAPPRPHYRMSLTGSEAEALAACVSQGIDAHLEAFTDSRFRRSHRMAGKQVLASAIDCEVAWHELPLLMRRLMELSYKEAIDYDPEVESEPCQSLAHAILSSLHDGDEYIDDVWIERYLEHSNRHDDQVGWDRQLLTEGPRHRETLHAA